MDYNTSNMEKTTLQMNDTCILMGEHHVCFILHSYLTILMLLKDITIVRDIHARFFLKIKLKKILKQDISL